MKVGIYSPYLDTLGGGEKYMLTIAETLSEKCSVDLLLGKHNYSINIDEFLENSNKIHNLKLGNVQFVKAPLGESGNFIERLLFLKNYDVLFYLTDGSVFFSSAGKSFIHFQVPFEDSTVKGLWGRLKINSFKLALFNSKFTKDIVEDKWKIKGCVLYPPVSVSQFKVLKKQKRIISVGRFFGYDRAKKHTFLIESFKKIVSKNKITDWSLDLVGGALPGDESYIDELRNISKGYKINIKPNLSFDELVDLYGQASIYWHATGFGENDPKKFEHFGITTVEAMASGCVPVVINKGGQKEIVENDKNGFLWDTEKELLDITLNLIKNPAQLEQISENSVIRSKKFSKEEFSKKVDELVYDK